MDFCPSSGLLVPELLLRSLLEKNYDKLLARHLCHPLCYHGLYFLSVSITSHFPPCHTILLHWTTLGSSPLLPQALLPEVNQLSACYYYGFLSTCSSRWLLSLNYKFFNYWHAISATPRLCGHCFLPVSITLISAIPYHSSSPTSIQGFICQHVRSLTLLST